MKPHVLALKSSEKVGFPIFIPIYPLSALTNVTGLWRISHIARSLGGRDRLDHPDSGVPSVNPSTLAVPICCCSEGPALYWSNPPVLIFDIRVLWRSVLSARASECQKLKWRVTTVWQSVKP